MASESLLDLNIHQSRPGQFLAEGVDVGSAPTKGLEGILNASEIKELYTGIDVISRNDGISIFAEILDSSDPDIDEKLNLVKQGRKSGYSRYSAGEYKSGDLQLAEDRKAIVLIKAARMVEKKVGTQFSDEIKEWLVGTLEVRLDRSQRKDDGSLLMESTSTGESLNEYWMRLDGNSQPISIEIGNLAFFGEPEESGEQFGKVGFSTEFVDGIYLGMMRGMQWTDEQLSQLNIPPSKVRIYAIMRPEFGDLITSKLVDGPFIKHEHDEYRVRSTEEIKSYELEFAPYWKQPLLFVESLKSILKELPEEELELLGIHVVKQAEGVNILLRTKDKEVILEHSTLADFKRVIYEVVKNPAYRKILQDSPSAPYVYSQNFEIFRSQDVFRTRILASCGERNTRGIFTRDRSNVTGTYSSSSWDQAALDGYKKLEGTSVKSNLYTDVLERIDCNENVLELGSGPGSLIARILRSIKEKRGIGGVFGLDYSEGMSQAVRYVLKSQYSDLSPNKLNRLVEQTRQRIYMVDLLDEGKAEDLIKKLFPGGMVDHALMVNFLYQFDETNTLKVLKLLQKVVKLGGRITITDPLPNASILPILNKERTHLVEHEGVLKGHVDLIRGVVSMLSFFKFQRNVINGAHKRSPAELVSLFRQFGFMVKPEEITNTYSGQNSLITFHRAF